MKNSLLLLVLVLFVNITKASNYYFSSALGSDDRTPIQAQNPATPWKTLNKLNSFFSNLRPGDALLLKRGDTFFGSIAVNKSGTAGAPIVVGAYGTGNKPVITSLVTLTGFTANNTYKGVFESSVNSPQSTLVTTVLLNGVVQELGRYPNSDAANNGYFNFESHTGTASITDNDLNSPVNWSGAELVLRSRRWVIDRDLITSQSGKTIFYTASSRYEPNDKFGYFIQNDIKTLDKPGEWYYNADEKKLSIYLGKNSSRYTVQAATIDNLISSAGFSNIVFQNLTITGDNASGFSIKNGSNISIENCDILFSGKEGIKVNNHKKFNIENSAVVNSNYKGIDLGYNCNYATIRNNRIINTSVLTGMGGSGDGKGIAIFANAKGAFIEYNEIRNTGYSAINFNGDSCVVKNNFIDSFCINKDDGAGIYTYGTPTTINSKGKKITGNIITNGIGEGAGTNNPSSASAEGIYMDNNSSNTEITDNTIANCSNQGIFINNSYEIIIANNTVYNSKRKQLSIVQMANHTQVRNCIVSNNIFFSAQASQKVSTLKADDNNVDLFGTFDKNYYVSPQDNNIAARVDKVRSYEKSALNINLNQPARFEYNATKVNKTIALDGSYADVKNNIYTKSISLKPFTSVILMKQGLKKLNID